MWDPRPWIQARPSFVQPVAPPVAGPCDPPLICVQFNQEYVPYVCGALMQLVQRQTCTAPDEDTLQGILANMTLLIEVIGTAVQCSQPPLIPGQPTLQRACNIAGYLANYIIRESMAQAIQSIQNQQLAVDFLWVVLRFIPGFGEAFSITTAALPNLFNAIESAGITDFQTAVNDPSLFGAITCAIYQAIQTDGQVTAGNYPAIVANVSALTFASSDVKTATINFITDMGPGGLQAVQVPGALQDYDCTGCGSGPALGPVGPNPTRITGTDLLQIAIGASDAILPILFDRAFPSPPLLTMGSDNEDVIVSAISTTATGTTLQITSAVPASATMSANVDWAAQLPGVE